MMIWYAIPSIIVWSIFLLAFFPGEMSPDSFSHWRQVQTHEFSNWQSVVYTWLMIGLTNIWDSPASIGLVQIVTLSLVFGYGMYRLQKAGIPPLYTWMMAGLFALSPINGIFSIIIWKDILYSTFIFLLSLIAFAIFATRGKWLNSWGHLFLFGFTSLAILLLRSTGIALFILFSILLLFSYRNYLKQIAGSLAGVLVLYFIVSGPVYDYFEVKPSDPNEALGMPTQQIARIITYDGHLTEEQENYYFSIMPKEKWIELYDPYITDPIKFSGPYSAGRHVIFEDLGRYFSNWFKIVMQNPRLAVEATLKQTSLVWQINEPEDGYTNLWPGGIYRHNTYGITQEPVSVELHHRLNEWLVWTEEKLKELIWRPATYLFTVILLTFAASLKNGWRAWVVATPVLLNTLAIFAAMPAQDFRYLYSLSMVPFLLLPFSFLTFQTVDEKT
ncbi:DUF6020 family protein [Oceanobacillus senegalensis]|uniref:DUF6020 family protein n=1 Tax=Oceanobacillus senegalensis TaxID=1936063 RepID=UPI00117DE788|nr:DUF6020 family protein [Oceanobacillus senegalensis]